MKLYIHMRLAPSVYVVLATTLIFLDRYDANILSRSISSDKLMFVFIIVVCN